MSEQNGLCERITNYLSHGGLFNPEHMEHEKVRALLMECRDALAGTYLSGVSGTTAEDKTSMATALVGLRANCVYHLSSIKNARSNKRTTKRQQVFNDGAAVAYEEIVRLIDEQTRRVKP